MPVLNSQLGPEGPVVNLLVGVSEPAVAALQAANQPVPPPVSVRALIDTGASCTCIVAGVLQPQGERTLFPCPA
jgi:hypothetical protein